MGTVKRDQMRIRLAGKGGQCIMLGRAILAEAANGLKVARTQEYGPEAHLGATQGPTSSFQSVR